MDSVRDAVYCDVAARVEISAELWRVGPRQIKSCDVFSVDRFGSHSGATATTCRIDTSHTLQQLHWLAQTSHILSYHLSKSLPRVQCRSRSHPAPLSRLPSPAAALPLPRPLPTSAASSSSSTMAPLTIEHRAGLRRRSHCTAECHTCR